MDPFGNAGDVWGRGVASFLEAQRQAFAALARMAPEAAPDAHPREPGFEAAEAAFRRARAEAEALAADFVARLGGQESKDPVAKAILAKVFDPGAWLAAAGGSGEASGAAAEPGLGDLVELERKLAALAAAWIARRGRQLEHDGLLLGAWSLAAERFSAALAARTEAGEPPPTPRASIDLWLALAEEALVEARRSAPVLASQRDLLRATTDLLLAQREVGETTGRMFGLPTRTEFDDVHRSLTELRREVRALARERRAAEEGR